MNKTTNADKMISRQGGSAAERAQERFEKTGERTSPYLMYPERESWTSVETFERPDGTRYTKTWDCGRWGGETHNDLVKTEEISAPVGEVRS